jgi:fatty-acid desaturase
MAHFVSYLERMAFTDRLLDPPSYGYRRGGGLYVPTSGEILREFARRLDPRVRHNWLAIFGVAAPLVLCGFGVLFFARFFSWPILVIAVFYGLFVMGSHANFWVHRYSTHRAFRFRGSLARELCRNLVPRSVVEETHVISHHVHHKLSEQPGDPYNVHGGWLYCFLADVNHQGVRKDLSLEEFGRLCKLLEHTGVRANSFAQYRAWGSVCHPVRTIAHFTLNWVFWFSLCYAVGGLSLAFAILGSAGFWALGYRTFNYQAHGGGRDLRRTAKDFHRGDLSVNLLGHGFLTGEWHNNHHLYPRSARAGFLWYQLDLPWMAVRVLSAVGAIVSYNDQRAEFASEHLHRVMKLGERRSENIFRQA